MATENEVLAVLELLQDAFPHMKMREGTPEVYARLLSDIPSDAIRAAADKCIAVSQYFPTVAQLREAAGYGFSPYLPAPVPISPPDEPHFDNAQQYFDWLDAQAALKEKNGNSQAGAG